GETPPLRLANVTYFLLTCPATFGFSTWTRTRPRLATSAEFAPLAGHSRPAPVFAQPDLPRDSILPAAPAFRRLPAPGGSACPAASALLCSLPRPPGVRPCRPVLPSPPHPPRLSGHRRSHRPRSSKSPSSRAQRSQPIRRPRPMN